MSKKNTETHSHRTPAGAESRTIFLRIVAIISFVLALTTHTLISQPCPALRHGVSGDSGLVAYYPFNGDAKDHSGQGNHGVVVGAGPVKDRFGRRSSAFLFRRANDYILIPKSSDFDFERERAFSIAFWVEGGRGDEPAILDVSISSGGLTCQYFAVIVNYHGETISVRIQASECWIDARAAMPDRGNHWRHLICTFDNEQMTLFLDGVMSAKQPLYDPKWTSFNLTGIRISPNAGQGQSTRVGFDDLRIYNRVLSPDEIEAMYRQESGSNDAGL